MGDTLEMQSAKASKITELSKSTDPLDLRKYDVPAGAMRDALSFPVGSSSRDEEKATELLRLGATITDSKGKAFKGGPNSQQNLDYARVMLPGATTAVELSNISVRKAEGKDVVNGEAVAKQVVTINVKEGLTEELAYRTESIKVGAQSKGGTPAVASLYQEDNITTGRSVVVSKQMDGKGKLVKRESETMGRTDEGITVETRKYQDGKNDETKALIPNNEIMNKKGDSVSLNESKRLTPEQFAQQMPKLTGQEPVQFSDPQRPSVPGGGQQRSIV